MDYGKLLWELQELKQSEAGLLKNEELKALIVSLKKLQEKVKKGEEETDSLWAKIDEGTNKISELEKTTDTLAQQARESKEKLYGTNGRSLKELLSLQQSIVKLEEQGKETEDTYWELARDIEQYKKEKEELKKSVNSWKKEYNEGVRKYKEIKKQIELKKAEFKNKEEEIREQLTPEVIRMYEEAEKRFPLNSVAILKNNACSGCRISLPSLLTKDVKSGRGIFHCDNCGRILINSF